MAADCRSNRQTEKKPPQTKINESRDYPYRSRRSVLYDQQNKCRKTY